MRAPMIALPLFFLSACFEISTMPSPPPEDTGGGDDGEGVEEGGDGTEEDDGDGGDGGDTGGDGGDEGGDGGDDTGGDDDGDDDGDDGKDDCDTGKEDDFCVDLDVASPYNLFVFYDYKADYTDIEGRGAAGTLFDMIGFSVGLLDQGGVSIVAGKYLELENGQLYGDAVYGISGNVTSDVNFYGGGSAYLDSPIDWASARPDLRAISTTLSGLSDTGDVDIDLYGGENVYLSGTDSTLNVFNVPASELADATYINIQTPAGSTTLINVLGSSASFGNHAIHLDGGSTSTTLWNFPSATTIDMDAIEFNGSILAPWAHVTFNNGQMNGTLVAGSAEGGGQYNLSLFEGEICL